MAKRARTKWPTEWTVTFTCLGVITYAEALERLVPVCEQLLEQYEQRLAGALRDASSGGSSGRSEDDQDDLGAASAPTLPRGSMDPRPDSPVMVERSRRRALTGA